MNPSALFHPSKTLEIEKVAALLEKGGPISSAFKNFETRQEQLEMLSKLVAAFNEKAIALIEAGTGTGKSIAYLLPALLFAYLYGERVVISTQTISLQEQILKKDLPILMRALGIQVKALLVKGMSNYPCLKKLEEAEFERLLLQPHEQAAFDKIREAAENGLSKSDLSFYPPPHLWELSFAEKDSCIGQNCPRYEDCSFIQARRAAQDARILVVNHHLLFADLAARAETQNFNAAAILPPYQRLVIDEAHHLEEIATEYFSTKISRLEILKTLSRISAEKQGTHERGKLLELKERMQKSKESESLGSELSQLLTLDLPAEKRDLLHELTTLFQQLEEMQDAYAKGSEEKKLRVREQEFALDVWKSAIQPQARRVQNALKRYAYDLERIEGVVRQELSERFVEQTKFILAEIKALAKKIAGEADVLERLIERPPTPEEIRWIESSNSRHGLNVSLTEAQLDISKILLQRLFEPLQTVALVSATLTARGQFNYLKERMGLNMLQERPVIELSVDSPFNYEEHALFLVPKDIPDPTEPGFVKKASELIVDAIEASRGNAFVLFTSYQSMTECFQMVEGALKERGYHLLMQGQESSSALLKRFISKDRSVLFGTDSFWEGVDVSGEALRLVVIVKLPFRVPTDPLVQARSEALEAKGKSAFHSLLLPHAAIKLKQGFGRLIRKKNDRGCILCLDKRVMTKNYGKFFLKSLPRCPLVYAESGNMRQLIADFFKRTYHLTKCSN